MKKIYFLIAFVATIANGAFAQSKEITVLFAYTKKSALEIGGGPAQIQKQVDYGIKTLNECLTNSNIGYTARAVPQLVEVDMSNDVLDARAELRELGKVDGKYNQVHQIRKEKQADIVCLIFSGEMKGIANLNGDMMVCYFGVFDDSYIFPHEFGHNLGAEHYPGEKTNSPNNYLIDYRGNKYRTVSNNGGISVPYYAENRSVEHEFRYQDANDNYKWKTEKKTIKLGDENYNSVLGMRIQAVKAAMFGEKLAVVNTVAGAYPARLVNAATEPVPAGGKDAFKFIDFTYNKDSKKAVFTYNASQIYCTSYKEYKIGAIDQSGKEVAGFGVSGGMNPGSPNQAECDFKTYTASNGYVAELKQGSKIQLWYTAPDGTLKLQKEIQVGDAIVFSSSNASDFITAFTVNEANSDVTVRYKATSDNVPYQIKYKAPNGGSGSSSGSLSKSKTEYTQKGWGDAPAKGTVYELYINGKVAKTYTVGGATTSTPAGTITATKSKNSISAGMSLKTTDEPLVSANGAFMLVVQTDGNLVIYTRQNGVQGSFTWASNKYGFPNANNSTLVMQTDGNLVVYDGAGTPQWASSTMSSGAVKLVLENDGKLNLYNAANIVVWTAK